MSVRKVTVKEMETREGKIAWLGIGTVAETLGREVGSTHETQCEEQNGAEGLQGGTRESADSG